MLQTAMLKRPSVGFSVVKPGIEIHFAKQTKGENSLDGLF
jgi:hypothetical protein